MDWRLWIGDLTDSCVIRKEVWDKCEAGFDSVSCQGGPRQMTQLLAEPVAQCGSLGLFTEFLRKEDVFLIKWLFFWRMILKRQ